MSQNYGFPFGVPLLEALGLVFECWLPSW